VRFYGFYLTAYVVVQILMVLSWQLMMLDEKGTLWCYIFRLFETVVKESLVTDL